MKRALLLLLVACGSEMDPDEYPVNPGGGGGGGGIGGGGADAGVTSDGGGDASTTLTGRVCLMTDVRDRTTCATTGAGDLTVTLGGQMTNTSADGSFTMEAPTGSGLAWRVTGANVMTSIVPLSFSNVLPAVSEATYVDLAVSNGGLPNAAEGAVFVRVVRGAMPLAGAVVEAAGVTPFYTTRYDGSSATVWDEDVTGVFGMAWLRLTSGTASITVTRPPGSPVTQDARVEAEAITWIDVAMP